MTIMKKIYLTIGLCLLTTLASAQWVTDMSCNSKAGKIADKAITHFVNLERPVAVGMARAALMIDETCGSAKLVLINSAMGGEYGTRTAQLEKLDTKKFTDQEKAWVKVMSASNDEFEGTTKQVAATYPDVPLFAFWASVSLEDGKDKLAEYVIEFPEYASPAYNIMSYRYADGTYGKDSDMPKAIETAQKIFLTHNGPNGHDSIAEHYATKGDYKKAFEHQLKALDYAGTGSAYSYNAQIYYGHTNKVALTDSITSKTKQRIMYQMKNDSQNLKQFYSDKVGMVGCNSNMEPCEFYSSFEEEDVNHTWNRWDVKDLKVYFSPDMKTALTTFHNDGEYTMKGSDEPIAYKTRASEVWLYDNGWKLMHSNFAPLAIGSGIPQTK
jgi:tetratricopeptide (TPR) repeat protein